MPYYDASKPLPIQIRDRMRDLLENDAKLREAYPSPKSIWRLPVDTVALADSPRAALTLSDETLTTPTAGMALHNRFPVLFLTVQNYFNASGAASMQVEEDAHDACIALTTQFQKALMRYQADPTDGVDIRLWDALEWEPRTTTSYRKGSNQWISTSIFTLKSFLQRNDD